VSGASIDEGSATVGCRVIPSRSRTVLSYWERVRRASCDVCGTPGVHVSPATTPRPVPVVPAVPFVPMLEPVPVPEPGPVREPIPESSIFPVQPVMSAAPTTILMVQVYMALTSSGGLLGPIGIRMRNMSSEYSGAYPA
jgi:hypothetical protein